MYIARPTILMWTFRKARGYFHMEDCMVYCEWKKRITQKSYAKSYVFEEKFIYSWFSYKLLEFLFSQCRLQNEILFHNLL